MKNAILSVVFLFGLGFSVAANATGDECLAACSSTITGDSGKTLKTCSSDYMDWCSCSEYGQGFYCWEVRPGGQACQSGWTEIGGTANGGTCCVDEQNICPGASATVEPQQRVDGPTAKSFEQAFNSMATLTENYWGYVDSSLRSPNTGRGRSAEAKLDTCLGYGDVDTITALASNDTDRYNYCAGSTYGCGTSSKNEHCQANGSAVCIDRCACMYSNNGVDTCNNL